MILPKRIFLTKGVGRHRDKLSSFEAALRDAGIERFNIVRVSSILPPGCKFIPKAKGLQYLTPGEIIFCVLAENSTNEPHRLISASIGVAVPKDPAQYGYLSEYHSFGETEAKAGDYAEDLAATMLATTLGVEFDPNASWDERKEIWKISGKIVRTMNITQTAIGDKRGWWTTVVAAAILIP
ncbi:MAG: arginine decarboxylase, pyruvoyl-dependent [candidate division WOR-3 bacterium]|nr:arginine decarboxylase, pyruvoyl-dependent [candidate division WOR-3 bacterium]MCX7757815.1 arginine decarboxylase, pyruvoyl-dependent [candidate division WOR-3 bacterium]MDW7987092.1 arginine decarboxylase, pyruvoyl-dependent [candidate division WOR-3 bacterium]